MLHDRLQTAARALRNRASADGQGNSAKQDSAGEETGLHHEPLLQFR
jgi:hypothetical protein